MPFSISSKKYIVLSRIWQNKIKQFLKKHTKKHVEVQKSAQKYKKVCRSMKKCKLKIDYFIIENIIKIIVF